MGLANGLGRWRFLMASWFSSSSLWSTDIALLLWHKWHWQGWEGHMMNDGEIGGWRHRVLNRRDTNKRVWSWARAAMFLETKSEFYLYIQVKYLPDFLFFFKFSQHFFFSINIIESFKKPKMNTPPQIWSCASFEIFKKKKKSTKFGTYKNV